MTKRKEFYAAASDAKYRHKKTAAVGRIGRKPYAQFKVNPLKC